MALFTDKVVVVTGAGSGIGRGLVAGFCRDGAHVVGIGRTEDDLRATADTHGHGRMQFVVGDVSRSEDVEQLFATTEDLHGRVDVLINNAAVYPKVTFLDSDINEWCRAIDINVGGMARCCHRALPGMLQRGHGRVINVGSYAWRGPIPMASAYSASKGAVHALTLAIAAEVDRYRQPDVLVNEWMPGVFRTRMTPDSETDPMMAYEGARTIASLGIGGAHGREFLGSQLMLEALGFKARVKQKLKALLGQ
jgi:NAD(P)-dependent dehydrogenase (short-subunit alcohol dehydrogenase family)